MKIFQNIFPFLSSFLILFIIFASWKGQKQNNHLSNEDAKKIWHKSWSDFYNSLIPITFGSAITFLAGSIAWGMSMHEGDMLDSTNLTILFFAGSGFIALGFLISIFRLIAIHLTLNSHNKKPIKASDYMMCWTPLIVLCLFIIGLGCSVIEASMPIEKSHYVEVTCHW